MNKISSFDGGFSIDNSAELLGSRGVPDVGGKKDAPGFAEEMAKAVGTVDQMQVQSDQEAAKIAAGGGNLHEAALAMEKADVAMRVMVKVRNKVVDAYQEIMRMTV